jgi:hypothetical protein
MVRLELLNPLRWGHASLFPLVALNPFAASRQSSDGKTGECVFRLSWFLDPGQRGLGEVVQPPVDL